MPAGATPAPGTAGTAPVPGVQQAPAVPAQPATVPAAGTPITLEALAQQVAEIGKSVNGMQTLTGRWSNEIGELRKSMTTAGQPAPEQQPAALPGQQQQPAPAAPAAPGTIPQTNGNPAQPQVQQPAAITQSEQEALNQQWGQMDEATRAQLLSSAQGATQQEKLSYLQNQMLSAYRENVTVVPEKLFGAPAEVPAGTTTPNQEAAQHFTALLYKSLGYADRQKNGLPVTSRTSNGATPVLTGGRQGNAPSRGNFQAGSGGVLERLGNVGGR